MENHLKRMECYVRNHVGSGILFLFDKTVKIVIRGKEIIIPFESIISIIYKKPGYFGRGSLEFKTAQEGYGSIHWGFGFSTRLNDANTILFDKENDHIAIEIKEYIEKAKKNVVNEINFLQLTQLKKLLDDKIITQEEYEAKKKQLLGL